MPRWFLLYDSEPLPGAENMARDEHLFNLCHDQKVGFLRIYSWLTPTFSIGASQKTSRAIYLPYLEQQRLTFVRRITGGKTVLHDHEVTYAVISSEDLFFKDNDLTKSYMLIAKFLVKMLEGIGIHAQLSSGSSASLARSNQPCFSFPTTHEIEIKGKKIIGSAQKRDKRALLQHGSIPLTMNFDMYAQGTLSNVDLLRKKMTTIQQEADCTAEQLIEAMISSFTEFASVDLHPYVLNEEDKKEIDRLKEKYLSDRWNHML